MTNPVLGYIHEKGAPEANIPARPFLIPGIRKSRDRVVENFRSAAVATLSMQRSKAEALYNKVGLVAVNSVRAVFTNNEWTPLKPATLRRKTRKDGSTASRPLIDTGQLRKAITYVISKTGGIFR